SCIASYCFLLFACAASAQDGASIYRGSCAVCHDAAVERAPNRESLKAISPERVLAAMESGAMVPMAGRLSAAERRALAEFLTGKSLGQSIPPPQGLCAMTTGEAPDWIGGSHWIGWGAGLTNNRFQDAFAAGITVSDVPRLKLMWAFGFP